MEKLIQKLIDNRAIVIFLAVIVSILGCVGYYYLPRQENPDVSMPIAMVITPYPGASAEDVQELVLKKIEDELAELDHIDEIRGTAKNGVGITIVKFDSNASNDKAMQDVRNCVKDAGPNLPKGTMDSIIKTDLVSSAGILISLSGGDYTYEQLASFGEQFKRKLAQVDGISKFEVNGELDKVIEVKLDIAKLNQLEISIEEINQVLTMQNIEIPSGAIKNGDKKVNVEITGSYDDIEDIRNTVLYVSTKTGISLRLKDIATVNFKLEEDASKFKQNGKNAVLLTGYFNEGENVVIIGDEVRAALDEVKNKLPENLLVEEIIYQPQDVATSVNDFMKNLVIGVILVIVVVFVGMGYRNAIVVSTAIPFSIVITFAVMYVAQIYIHQMSLTALIIALGILVDNAIVISDGIQTNIDSGMTNRMASGLAVKRAALPIFTATLTTIAAFSPLMGMPGGAGEFLLPIPLVLIISVIASYIVAMFIMPVLGEWLFKPTNNKDKKVGLIRKRFESMLERGLKHKGITLVGVLVVFLVVMIVVMPLLPSQFFPNVEKDLLYLDINAEIQGDINATERLTDQVVELLSDDKEITSSTVAIGDGLPKFYVTMMPSSPSSDFAQMLLKYDLNANENKRFNNRAELANYLQSKCDSNIVGGKVKVNMLQNGLPLDAMVIARISGESYERLVEVVKEIHMEIEKMDGITKLRDNTEPETLQYSVDLDSESAIMMGISNYDVQRQINMALYGSKPTVYRKDGKEYDVLLKSDIDEPSYLENFMIKSSIAKNKVPLKQYANVTYSTKVDTINRFNKEMSFAIFADPKPGYNSSTLEDIIEHEILPKIDTSGVTIRFDGERESIKENFSILGKLAVLAIGLIFVILVIQFRSFVQASVILMTIPLSLIGSILGLFLFKQPLSLTAFLGIIALIGLVVKNGILLIEYINDALKEGHSIEESCIDAVDKRFNAIILSALTTIMGLLPLAVGGNSLFAPMALSLMAGLMVSTVLTMVIIPVVFSASYNLQSKKNK